MDLFSTTRHGGENLLPGDGVLNDFGALFPPQVAERLFAKLFAEVPWRPDRVRIGGRVITTARQVAWYGEADFPYTYSGVTRRALPLSDVLRRIRGRVEERTGVTFNSCLLNLYRDGSEGMAWHRDSERELCQPVVIASLSLGATRRFAVRHLESRRRRELSLFNGQLILMGGGMQAHWQHCVPKQAGVTRPRINLTFRRFRGRETFWGE